MASPNCEIAHADSSQGAIDGQANEAATEEVTTSLPLVSATKDGFMQMGFPVDAGSEFENPKNAFRRRMRAAVLQAAGLENSEDTNAWAKAKAGLKVVNIGHFDKAEGRSCACGQKPLQNVFHLRHEGTGKLVHVGSQCAKTYQMLGDLATKEAEEALNNLKELVKDPKKDANKSLLKFARLNGIITSTEENLLKDVVWMRKHPHQCDDLKNILTVGLDFARRSNQEIASLLPEKRYRKKEPEVVANIMQNHSQRRALLRLALLKRGGRQELLRHILPTCRLEDADITLGAGLNLLHAKQDPDNLPEPEKHSLAALLVQRGCLADAGKLLAWMDWSGVHAQAALLAAVLYEKIEFIEDYLHQPDAMPPGEAVGKWAIRQSTASDGRALNLILDWYGRGKGKRIAARKAKFVDAALEFACAGGSVALMQQLFQAGGRNVKCNALLRWCARLSGEKPAWAAELPGLVSGEPIGKQLLETGAEDHVASARQLERTALHCAAWAGDAPLLSLLLDAGSSPWSVTTTPSQILPKSIVTMGRRLPLTVARRSEKETCEVEQILRQRMEEELQMLSDDKYQGYISIADVKLLHECLIDGAGAQPPTSLLQEVEQFTQWIRYEPDKARAKAEAKRQKEYEKRRARAVAEEEQRQKEYAEQQARIQHIIEVEEAARARAKEQTRINAEQAARLVELRVRQQREKDLKFVAGRSVCEMRSGMHMGRNYLDIWAQYPRYVSHWLEDGPGPKNHFGDFAQRMRDQKFTCEEVVTEQKRQRNQCPHQSFQRPAQPMQRLQPLEVARSIEDDRAPKPIGLPSVANQVAQHMSTQAPVSPDNFGQRPTAQEVLFQAPVTPDNFAQRPNAQDVLLQAPVTPDKRAQQEEIAAAKHATTSSAPQDKQTSIIDQIREVQSTHQCPQQKEEFSMVDSVPRGEKRVSCAEQPEFSKRPRVEGAKGEVALC